MMPLFNKIFPANVIAFTSDRTVDFKLDKTQHTLSETQKKFLSSQLNLNLPEPVHVRQVHGNRVIVAGKNFSQRRLELEEADGLITKDPNVLLAVRSADCLPVFLFDEKQGGIGLVHVGWRGLQNSIIRQAVLLMQEQWGSDPQDIKVVFGPSIRSCCYEVGKEFKKHFPGQLISRDSHLFLDLPKVNFAQLTALGVKKENISDCNICTCCDQNYFSLRRENTLAGRMISLIMMKGKR